MRNVIITGSDGFLGSHLVDFLLKKGFFIFAFIKPNSSMHNLAHYLDSSKKYQDIENEAYLDKKIKIPTNEKHLKILEVDINDFELVEQLIYKIKPNIIYHFAAQPYVIPSWENPRSTIQTNIIGTINIFEPIKKYNIDCRVVLAGSSAAYGTTTKEIKRALKESDPLKAIHPYGISKIATELMARQYYLNFNIDIVNLRFFNQTGPRKTNDACSDFIQKVAQIELDMVAPIIEVGNLDPYRDIMGIKDTIQAIWLGAEKGRSGETYNVCSNRKIQIRKVLEISLSFSSKKIKVIENKPEKLRKTDEDIILGDNSNIREELNFEIQQSVEEFLKEMFNYWINYYKNYKK
ncbi:MAG: GDP-mannose 4,6-dehydratase [Candidatus Lokiarchaeota archaeon]|nr:GDP-mannose 4,6-dehydratase [Candidatus Lokiarchaeota archaeon]